MSHVLDIQRKRYPIPRFPKVSDLILHLVGAATTGFTAASAKAVRPFADDAFGEGNLLFSSPGVRLSGYWAGSCHRAAASALDIDDGDRLAIEHAGAAVNSAVIAEYDGNTVACPIEEDAIANGSLYRPGGYGDDLQKAYEFASGLRASRVCFNGEATNSLTSMDGYKPSGIGRSMGPFGLEEYRAVKSVYGPEEKAGHLPEFRC